MIDARQKTICTEDISYVFISDTKISYYIGISKSKQKKNKQSDRKIRGLFTSGIPFVKWRQPRTRDP